ncbi:Redoxin domain protein [Candidatus Sulfopaludibacter sp. SbA3]|nr:Redoxin domain protein [Candidatus Sulfopaludibacter sp. SbA3]
MHSPVVVAFLWMAVPLCVAATGGTVEQAAARFDQLSAKVPAPLGLQFRVLGAKALQTRHPDLALKLAAPEENPGPAARRVDPASTETGLAIVLRLAQFSHLPSDKDRARLLIDLASEIRALPAGPVKFSLAWELHGAATEGDLGQPALTAVVDTFADAIPGAPPDASNYLELAGLIRYEHVRAPKMDSALDAALALLELRERLHQEAGFSLAALDGQQYSLTAMRSKVVLLNFWATTCFSCRREMPDLEKIYREFRGKGLVVLAVSDEKRETIEKFLATKNYTFPILLDSGRKVNTDFDIDGIPESFVFDREGNLVAQALDMRTKTQFRAMLKAAGIE